MKQYSFFVPKGVDMSKLIAANPPSIINFQIEKVLYILDVMSQIPARNHDIGEENGFVPLNASILRDNIGNRYHQYLDWLVESGVLECNNHFSKEYGISRKYKFTEQYDNPLEEYTIPITKWMEGKVYRESDVPPLGVCDWWEYALEVPLSPNLKNILPAHSSALNQNDSKEYRSWMRSIYPSLFNWYDLSGLHIDKPLANAYNDAQWRFRTHGYKNIDKRWNRKKSMRLPKNPTSQYNSNRYNIFDLASQNHYPRFDSNVMRLYSSLVSMNKELRPTISWHGQPLVAIDISNSQPYLLAALLNRDFWLNDGKVKSTVTLYDLPYHNNYINLYPITNIITLCNFFAKVQPPDIRTFLKIVTSGRFYESLMKLMPPRKNGKAYTREEMKTLMLTVLFSPNDAISQGWAKAKRDFAILFPSINMLIRLIQRTDVANLPCLLQRLESHLMYNHIIPRICCELADIPVFTIHDSIVTTVGNEKRVAHILREELYYATNNMPSYKYEYWNANTLRHDLYWSETLFEYLKDCYSADIMPHSVWLDEWVGGLSTPFIREGG